MWGGTGFEPLADNAVARLALLWACQMVALGASGPFDHRPVLLKLFARRWLGGSSRATIYR
jgi:hypothetical protein